MPDKTNHRFHRLIEPHLDALFRAAYRLTRNRPDAEDLVQEACIRAFERLDSLSEERAVKSWLLRVLHNLFVDGARRARVAPFARQAEDGAGSHQPVCPAPTPEELLDRAQRLQQLDDAWQTLDPAQRALLALCAEGYSNTEIATIAAISADAVSMRLHRARRSLAQALHQDRITTASVRLEAVK
ncbi:MAG: RNA polymerase sigma factor [Chloroflexota bacterium]|nr:RNA polymerase sigma factor [Chloroflexota bacterium]